MQNLKRATTGVAIGAGLLAFAFTVFGCAGHQELLSQVPQKFGTAAVDYQALAACVAARLDQPGLIKSDFPTQRRIRLSVDSGGVRYFEIEFRGTAPKSTDWSVSVVNTIWGAFPGLAEKATTAINVCATPNSAAAS